MERVDVLVVGGGIAGSVAARFLGEAGLKVLLVERAKVPRNKVCTGLQFHYFEKLIGTPIPPEKLCRTELTRMEIVRPSGHSLGVPMKLLNFWRATFDAWLNELAVQAGAHFEDDTVFTGFREEFPGFVAGLEHNGTVREVQARYLIGADGANSRVRKILRPQDFVEKSDGGILNLYFKGEGFLEPNTVYMFYNVDFAPATFATTYLKDDERIIATGADYNPRAYLDRFYKFLKQKYWLRGKISRREGFASTLVGGPFLGEGNLLLAGDAAGLLDPFRVLGMDNAALSGRLAARAVLAAEAQDHPVLEVYREAMSPTMQAIQAGRRKQADRYRDNETLEESLLSLDMARSGMMTLIADALNTFLPPDDVIRLPA